jgi:hypothetical protein
MPAFYFHFSGLVVYFLSVKISDRGKYKTLTLQEKMLILNKLYYGASIQSVMNQCGVTLIHITTNIT